MVHRHSADGLLAFAPGFGAARRLRRSAWRRRDARKHNPATPAIAAGSSRSPGIDVVRGLAVLFVVFMHAAYVLPYRLPATIEAANSVVAAIRMPVLFLVTGWLSARTVIDRRKMIGRSGQLLWLHVVWTVGVVLTGMSAQSLLSELVLPTSHLWYIWALVLLLPLGWMVGGVASGWLVAATLAASLFIDSRIMPVPNLAIDHSLKFAVFFVIGVRYGRQLLSTLLRHPRGSALLLLGATGALHAANLAALEATGWPPFRTAERLAACGLLCAVALVTADWRVMRPLAWLGSRTMPIFLAHPFALRLVPPVDVDPYLDPFILTGLAVALCLALHRIALWLGLGLIYDKPGPKAFAALRGGWRACLKRIAALWRRLGGSAKRLRQWMAPRGCEHRPDRECDACWEARAHGP